MATPLALFTAAERLCSATISMDGSKSTTFPAAQTQRLINEINNLSFDHEAGIELIEVLADKDRRTPFTTEQRAAIANTVNSILSGVMSAVTDTRAFVKEQECLTPYKYYPLKLWAILRSLESVKNKARHVSHFHVETLGLRNADGKTRRAILATLYEASGIDPTPDEAYSDMCMIAEIMRLKRDEIPGNQTMRTFPDDPAEFMKRYPTAYPDEDQPVPCPIDVKKINIRCTKELIPIRNSNDALVALKNNKSIRRQHSSVGGSSSHIPQMPFAPAQMGMLAGGIMQQFDMNQLMQMARMMAMNFINNPDGNAVHAAAEIPLTVFSQPRSSEESMPSASAADGEHASDSIIGRKYSGLPGCLMKATSGADNAARLQALQADVDRSLKKTATKHDTQNAHDARGVDKDEKEEEEGAEEESDESDGEGAEKLTGNSMKGRPAASTCIKVKKSMKTTSTAMKSMKKTTPKAKMKAKERSSAKLRDVLGEKPKTIGLFPHLVAELLKSKVPKGRPKPAKTPTEYKKYGAKIYYNKAKRMLRVYSRPGDKLEQRIPIDFNNKASAAEAWSLACACIENDHRKPPKA